MSRRYRSLQEGKGKPDLAQARLPDFQLQPALMPPRWVEKNYQFFKIGRFSQLPPFRVFHNSHPHTKPSRDAY